MKVMEEQKVERRESNQEPVNSSSLKNKKRSTLKSSNKNLFGSKLSLNKMNQEKIQTKYIKLQITIEDNGVGISKQNQDKLFQKYSRLDEHKSMNFKGTGLGLCICK